MNNTHYNFHKLKLAFTHLTFNSMENVEFLTSPKSYFETLLHYLKTAQNVFISTLALGYDGDALQILDILKWRKQTSRPTLIIIDKYRASRTRKLFEIINRYDIRSLFVLHDTRTYKLLPFFIQEMLSVLHSKIFVFDNKILLTGANLINSYFAETIDRYILFESEGLTANLIIEFFGMADMSNMQVMNSASQHIGTSIKSIVHKFDREDELNIIKNILELPYNEIFISTPYLNFSNEHLDLLKNKNINIITASPHTNTFRFNNMMEKYVIESYTRCIADVIKKLDTATFYEYVNEDSRFHSKGFWIFGDDFVCTVIGSSNFNMRSIFRDIECNFLILSGERSVINKCRTEVNEILKQSRIIENDEMEKRHVSVLSRVLKYFGKGYL